MRPANQVAAPGFMNVRLRLVDLEGFGLAAYEFDTSLRMARVPLAEKADTEHRADGDMRGADRQAEPRSDDDREGGRQRYAIGTRRIELGDLFTDEPDEPRAEKQEADRD